MPNASSPEGREPSALFTETPAGTSGEGFRWSADAAGADSAGFPEAALSIRAANESAAAVKELPTGTGDSSVSAADGRLSGTPATASVGEGCFGPVELPTACVSTSETPGVTSGAKSGERLADSGTVGSGGGGGGGVMTIGSRAAACGSCGAVPPCFVRGAPFGLSASVSGFEAPDIDCDCESEASSVSMASASCDASCVAAVSAFLWDQVFPDLGEGSRPRLACRCWFAAGRRRKRRSGGMRGLRAECGHGGMFCRSEAKTGGAVFQGDRCGRVRQGIGTPCRVAKLWRGSRLSLSFLSGAHRVF